MFVGYCKDASHGDTKVVLVVSDTSCCPVAHGTHTDVACVEIPATDYETLLTAQGSANILGKVQTDEQAKMV